jgi:hypothetical protein
VGFSFSGAAKMSGVGSKDSIPSHLGKVIQNIMEITGNHSEDEIHAMLKECSMDPDETAQKLLLQGTIAFPFSFFRVSASLSAQWDFDPDRVLWVLL